MTSLHCMVNLWIDGRANYWRARKIVWGKGGQERKGGAGKESFTIKKVVVCSSIGGFCCDDNNCDYW